MVTDASGAPIFESTRYRYSITLPMGWVGRGAFQAWDGSNAPNAQDASDDLFGPADQINEYGVIKVWTVAAPATSPLATFVDNGIRANYADHGDTCPKTPDTVEPVTIGGQPGTFVAWNCGFLINGAFAIVNGYGYRFNIRDSSKPKATDPTDKALFLTMLGSVVFH